MNILKNIIPRATKKNQFTLLVLPYDGIYEQLFPQHVVWTNPQLSIKPWANPPKPTPNLTYFKADNHNVSIPEYLCFDAIIVHDITRQYEIGQKISSMYQCPLFVVIHDSPKTKWEKHNIKNVSGKKVYCSQELAMSWEQYNGIVINYPTTRQIIFEDNWNTLFNNGEIQSHANLTN